MKPVLLLCLLFIAGCAHKPSITQPISEESADTPLVVIKYSSTMTLNTTTVEAFPDGRVVSQFDDKTIVHRVAPKSFLRLAEQLRKSGFLELTTEKLEACRSKSGGGFQISGTGVTYIAEPLSGIWISDVNVTDVVINLPGFAHRIRLEGLDEYLRALPENQVLQTARRGLDILEDNLFFHVP